MFLWLKGAVTQNSMQMFDVVRNAVGDKTAADLANITLIYRMPFKIFCPVGTTGTNDFVVGSVVVADGTASFTAAWTLVGVESIGRCKSGSGEKKRGQQNESHS